MTMRPTLRDLLARGPIHFMGAGGAGMCALAEAVYRAGGDVTACDREMGSGLARLASLGVRVEIGHDPAHLDGAAALVVTAAVPSNHPELKRAHALGLPVLKRAEALGGWVARGQLACVAGTHGKTTTTALLTSILAEAGLEPTGFVGGEVLNWASHLHPGNDRLFVVEADEFDRSFHHLTPDVTVVTNVEADHLEIYGDLAGVQTAFARYLEGVREGGTVWVCADDRGAAALLQGLPAGVAGMSYGFSEGSLLRGIAEGDRTVVLENEQPVGAFVLPIPGMHNRRNALGAAGAARTLGVAWPSIFRGLERFGGVRRRFQRLGDVRGIGVIDDYAHHPTEVSAAIAAARALGPARLVAVFQPHLYTRTRDFREAFGAALAQADVTWVTEIYPAREEPIPGVDGACVVDSVHRAGGTDVRLHPSLDDLPDALSSFLREGDVCLLMGAGSIAETGPRLVRVLEQQGGSEDSEHPARPEHGDHPDRPALPEHGGQT
jgi:UDP-N-acetylmuramate--alanine ligase